jgi:hypothetical protein
MAATKRRELSNPIAAAFAQHETAYFGELGKMIRAYATAEAGVHCLARYLSGLPDAKARAVFGGMRLLDLIDLVRQMMRIDETPDGSLAQLKAIASGTNSFTEWWIMPGHI